MLYLLEFFQSRSANPLRRRVGKNIIVSIFEFLQMPYNLSYSSSDITGESRT